MINQDDDQESTEREINRPWYDPPDDPTNDPFWDNSVWGQGGDDTQDN